MSIAANKVPGIRAALYADGATAAGARQWNHANVLVMSLRMTSPQVAKEILKQVLGTNVEFVKRCREGHHCCEFEVRS